MRILVSGCSFSSGHGYDNLKQNPAIWPNLLASQLSCQVDNVAETASSNHDIFLATMLAMSKVDYDMVIVQWSAKNRITLSPSPANPRVIASYFDSHLVNELYAFTDKEIEAYQKIMVTLNQDWKHYFDLVDMITTLQQSKTPVYFVNGLLPWIREFFTDDKVDAFTKRLVQSDQFGPEDTAQFIEKVNSAKYLIDKSRWVNLTVSWYQSKIDTVSKQDDHPGPKSQKLFADQIFKFLKEKHAQSSTNRS